MKKFLFLLMLIPAVSFGAELSITIPDAIAPRVLNALAKKWGYDQKVLNEQGQWVDQPLTKAQFVKAKLIEYLKREVVEQEQIDASEEAALSAREAAESEVNLQ